MKTIVLALTSFWNFQMLTAVHGQDGDVLDRAKEWGMACVAGVDLSQRTLWPWLGDFKAQIPRHRPVARGE